MRTTIRILVRILAGLAVFAGVLGAIGYWLLWTPTPLEPNLSGSLVSQSLRLDGRERTYRVYTPARVKPGAPLVLVFHGRMGNPGAVRLETGYRFDELADQHGFQVAYPQGIGGEFNGCRRSPPGSTPPDDVAFVRELVARLNGGHPRPVYAAGVSNGGQMVYRLALEAPDLMTAGAVFVASLPMEAETVCRPARRAVPMLIVNGVDDPINPYAGGMASLFGLKDLGEVRSSRATAAYFAGLFAPATPRTTRLAARKPGDPTSVERVSWNERVVLMAVNGGGHVTPQPAYRPRRLLGRATSAIDGPAEAWAFFGREPLR